MADTAKVYTNGLVGFFNGAMSWKTTSGSTFKLALLTTSYTPNQDTDEFWDDISANEVAESGTYSAGGATLTTADPTVDTASNETRFDASDVSFTSFTGTAGYMVIYQSTGTAGTSRLICYQAFDPAKAATNGTFAITFAAAGVFKVTAA